MHAFPVGLRELSASLQSGQLSEQQRLATLEGLRIAYEEEIDKWGHRRQWEKALSFLQQMREQGVSPKASTYATLMKACGDKARAWRFSLHLLEEMQEMGLEVNGDAMTWAVGSCSNGQQWRLSIEVMRALIRQGVPPQRAAYTWALRSCGIAGLWQEAVDIMSEMEVFNIVPTRNDFHNAMRACWRAKEDDWFEWVEDRAAANGVEVKLA